MESCSRLVALLVDYLEERLPASVHADLEQHLSTCDACVAYLRTYRSTIALLRSLREEDLPPELRTSLRAFLDVHANN